MTVQVRRRRVRIGMADDPCRECGHLGLEIIESRRQVAGAGLWRRLQGRRTRRYLRCPDCGTRADLTGAADAVRAPRAAGSRAAAGLGWLCVGVLCVATVVLTVALAGMLLLISPVLALSAVVAVLLAVVLIIRHARRPFGGASDAEDGPSEEEHVVTGAG